MKCWKHYHRVEHIHRVFQVRSGSSQGTAFALDVDGRQYLVSALHVVEYSTNTASIDIFYNDKWVTFTITVVGIDFDNDIAVLALNVNIVTSPAHIHVAFDGFGLGQQVFILGYPLGVRGQTFSSGFPLPIVTKGIIAASASERGVYISVSAPPGFSGGPVYFAQLKTGAITLMAVVIAELSYDVSVKNAEGTEIGKVAMASNITERVSIYRVISIIHGKPIGFLL